MNITIYGWSTSVPFTSGDTGPERTTTDKANAGLTCTSHRLPR
jgi:hypothetical protein